METPSIGLLLLEVASILTKDFIRQFSTFYSGLPALKVNNDGQIDLKDMENWIIAANVKEKFDRPAILNILKKFEVDG